MEIDQLIFKKFWNLFSNKNTATKQNTNSVTLENIKDRLCLLARLLSGKSIEIFPAENYSGWKNNIYFLPAKCNIFEKKEDNYFYYLFRIVYLSIQQENNINWKKEDVYTIEHALLKSKEYTDFILNIIKIEFPIIAEKFDTIKIINTSDLNQVKEINALWFGKLMLNDDEQKSEILDKKSNQWVKDELQIKKNKSSEINGKSKENVEIIEVDKEKQEEYLLTHNFEKVDTIEEFNGNWRDFDDDEDLDTNEEAINELNLQQMVRVDSPSHSIYKTDFFNTRGIAESKKDEAIEYTTKVDEWDYKLKKYKKEYCNVFVTTQHNTNSVYVQDCFKKNTVTFKKIERKLISFFNADKKVKKQQDGDIPDIDALTERFSDIYVGITPSDKIFISKRKKNRDIAILILTDLSLSTDGYVQGKKIIDVEKQSLLLFGEILSKYGTPFQIDCFSSKTRNQCEYITIKSFSENWKNTRNRIGAIEPKGYTRIGAAIRNANNILSKHPAQKKWLLILTDGKPNDYDRYEGKYGIEDVKQAVKEVRRNDIKISALAIEADAKYYLPQMLGKGSYQIMNHPNQLPEKLTQFYMELLK